MKSRKKSLSSQEQEWLKHLGRHIEKLILNKGYKSIYDFWINKAGDTISRMSLSNLVRGQKDCRATTLRRLAKLLNVPVKTILDFE